MKIITRISCLLALCAAQMSAQTAAPATRGSSTTTASSSGAEETIELTPFTVNAERDVGYIATSSLAGSRMNTELKDTAASISVLTKEFLDDIGATSLVEAMEWSTNTQLQMGDNMALASTADDQNGTFFGFESFRIRGLPSTSTRNYFPWAMPTDSYNIERVEEARGPNSILFGIGSAGGVVNTSTKRANLSRRIRSASVGFSSHGGWRGTIDLNERFGNRFALRVNGVADRTGSFRNYVYGEKQFAHIAATFKATPSTTLRAEYETGRARRVVGSNQQASDVFGSWVAAGSRLISTPIAANQNAAFGVSRLGAGVQLYYIGNTGTVVNMANQYRTSGNDFALPASIVSTEVAMGGPGAMQRPHFDTVSVILEQQFGRNTFLELAYNHQQYKTNNYMPAGDSSRLYIDPNSVQANGQPNPYAGRYFVEGETWIWDWGQRTDNTRLTLAHELNLGKWGRYRFAGMGEYEWRSYRMNQLFEVWDGAPFNSAPENAANVVRRRNYVTLGDWGSFYRTMPLETGLLRNVPDPVVPGRTLNSTFLPRNPTQVRDHPENQTSVLLAMQARYFKDRLVLGLGYREDKLNILTRGTTRDANNFITTDYANNTFADYEGKTKTAGAVYHITPKISVFYNLSSNFSLPPNIRLVPDGRRASNPESEGSDYGIAFNLFDGKLSARASYYKTDLTNGANSNYGGTTTAPQQVGDFILNALMDRGLISAAEADTHRVDNTGATYSQLVEGYEFNLTANPTRNWRLQANFSYTDGMTSEVAPEIQDWVAREMPFFKSFDQTIVTSNASRTIAEVIEDFEDYHNQQMDFVGLVLSGNRKYKVNLFTSYSFSEGLLKGLTVGGGYRHQSKIPIGQYTDGSLQYGPSYWESHGMIGYRFAQSPLLWLKRVRVQLNVQNLFDEDEAYILRRVVAAPGTPGSPEAIRRTRMREPRTWRLTTTFDF